MPTSYTDQFYVVDPSVPMPAGTVLTVQKFDFVDADDNGFLSGVGSDTLNGLDITHVWVGDRVTMDFGSGPVQVTGVTFYLRDGTSLFTPTDGTVLQDGTLVACSFVTTASQIAVGTLGPPCFVTGTLIETPDGPRRIETLRAGDLVTTADRGPQPLVWAGGRTVLGRGAGAPVRFAPGVLGNDRPLLVSQQHRMMLTGWQVELLFGTEEVLAAARHLVNGDEVSLMPAGLVGYHHLLFERHEIIFAEGAPSESFRPGDHLATVDAGLLPDPALWLGMAGIAARPMLRAHEAVLWRKMTLPASSPRPAALASAA